MKKLMIAACAVALATVAQAANINWGFNTVYGIGDGGKGYAAEDAVFTGKADVQLIIGTTLTEGVIGGIVYDAVTQNMDFSYGYAFPSAIEGVALVNNTSYYTQVILTSGDSTLTSGIFELYNASAYDGELNPNWGGAGEYANLDDATTGSLTGLSTFEDEKYGTFSAAGWQAASVPEPTSGLLLLLGVAGLALRRRRA